MDWTEVTVSVDAKDVDRAGDIAQMVVAYGIYVEDYSHLEEEAWEIAHIDLIDEDLLKKDRTKALVHVYISPEENPAEAIAFSSGIMLKESRTPFLQRPVRRRIGFIIGRNILNPSRWERNC